MKNILQLFFAFFFVISSIATKAQSVIYTQTFNLTSLPTGWQNNDNTGNNAGKWLRKTSGYGFASTTASNGFYVFDSDALGNDNKAENADLITSAINCFGKANVALEFEHFFQQFQGSVGTVSVSTDNQTWTSVFSVTATTENPEKVIINLTPYASGTPTLYIKFNYVGNYDYWWCIDDIKVFEPAALDVSVKELSLTKYVPLSNQTVSGVLFNNGYTAINTVDLTYKVNGSNPVTQSLTGLNIPAFGTYNFTFNQPIAMSTAKAYNVEVTAEYPNSLADQNLSNNSATQEVFALSALPEKNVLFEEFTTTPCGWCPDGHVRAAEIEALHSYFIPVNIHAGFGTDGMTTPEASTIAAAFANGAPTACIDRVKYKGEERVGISRNLWKAKVEERRQQLAPSTVAATSSYNNATRELSVTVTAKFYSEVAGDFRLNAFIVEDSVVGPNNNQFNQSNFLNNTAGHPMQGRGNPIIGYVHRHVERYAMGGAWGASGVVTSPTSNNQEYTKTFTYTLPQSWNDAQCKVVAFVHEYNQVANSGKNEILNSVILPLNGSATQTATPSVFNSITEIKAVNNVSLYPNPAVNELNIAYTLNKETAVAFEISNLMGQKIASIPASQSTTGVNIMTVNTASFEPGIYLVSVIANNQHSTTLKFVVSQ